MICAICLNLAMLLAVTNLMALEAMLKCRFFKPSYFSYYFGPGSSDTSKSHRVSSPSIILKKIVFYIYYRLEHEKVKPTKAIARCKVVYFLDKNIEACRVGFYFFNKQIMESFIGF